MKEQELVQLAQELVRIPSPSYHEEAVAERVVAAMEPIFDSVMVTPRHDVIGILAGSNPKPCILFNAHLDHVAPGTMNDPFSGVILDGERFGGEPGDCLYGRGASDNKGGLAAMIAAAKDLRDTGFPGTLVLTAVTREETGTGAGTIEAVTRVRELGVYPDVAVSAESTDGCIGLGHRGKVEFELETLGRTAHASNPANGINAIELMAEVISALHHLPAPEDSVFGRCTSAITDISCSPGQTGVVPDRCRLVFDNRFLPNELPTRAEEDVRKCLQELQDRMTNFDYSLKAIKVMPAYMVNPEDEWVHALHRAVAHVTKSPTRNIGWKFGIDGSFLMLKFGIPTIGFGPGNETFAHTPQEHVPIRELETSRQVYREFVRQATP